MFKKTSVNPQYINSSGWKPGINESKRSVDTLFSCYYKFIKHIINSAESSINRPCHCYIRKRIMINVSYFFVKCAISKINKFVDLIV